MKSRPGAIVRSLAFVHIAIACAAARADGPNGFADRLPPNQWVKVAARQPYAYSQPVYAPARRQVLIWGAAAGGDAPRNEVLAFDADQGEWVSDRPAADPRELARAADSGAAVGAKGGRGAMLPGGTPAPAHVVNAVCYDSRRDQVVVALNGLTAAYDPAARTSRDLKAETELWGAMARLNGEPYGMYERGLRPERDETGQRLPGGPPLFGAGTCYDPVNDEVLLFPHWGAQNADRRAVDGRMSGHAGTFIYSFKDNLWRRAGPALGTAEARRARQALLALSAEVSGAMDEAWLLRRRPDARRQAQLADRLRQAARDPVADPLRAAAADVADARFDAAIRSAAAALRGLDSAVDALPRIEPPPRHSAPMVYDPKREVVVLFGGQDNLVRTDLRDMGRDPPPGALDDTWLYDVRTRQWLDATRANRPPGQRNPLLAYDDASGLVLLVTRRADGNRALVTLWSFDAATGEWARRHEQSREGLGGGDEWAGLALDASRRVLVMTQGPDTYAFRVDLEKLPSGRAPRPEPAPPAVPHEVPGDDPAWVAAMKDLPANRWVHAKPPRDANSRDWGVAACDAVRGHVYYFGGGHSTYQVNDVAVYAVGANRWAHAPGDHNDYVPPARWDGQAMGFRGGPPAGHQRNSYVAFDGRMYVFAGGSSRRWDAEPAKWPGARHAWFHDLDRGGVWRQQAIARVTLGDGVTGSYGRPHVVDPARGIIYGFAGHLEPYDGRLFQGEAYLSAYDVHDNSLTVTRIPEPSPGWVGEGRPFCVLPDRWQVFFYEYRKGEGGGHRTWAYDVRANRFVDLKPARQPPPGEPRTVEYIDGQGAVFAIVGKGEQWVYSFARNTWAPLPTEADGPIGFAEPYAQTAYVARYGVLVNTGSASRGLAVMRPDFGRVRWED